MAESKAIADVETGLVKGFDDCVDGVRLQAKEIRSLTARMNKVPKVLGNTQTVIPSWPAAMSLGSTLQSSGLHLS